MKFQLKIEIDVTPDADGKDGRFLMRTFHGARYDSGFAPFKRAELLRALERTVIPEALEAAGKTQTESSPPPDQLSPR